MKIDVIELKLSTEYSIDIPSESEFIYGVESAAPVFCNTIGGSNVEQAALLCLDSTSKVINYSKVAIGNANSVQVPIPQILRIALLSNASKIIVGHNHPSGVLDVTSVDIDITKKIGALANLFKITLIDSIIVNKESALSIREYVGDLKNEC